MLRSRDGRIAARQPLVRDTRPLVSGAGAVPPDHRSGVPTGELHQVDLGATGRKPAVSEGVAEAVGVHIVHARLLPSSSHHVADAVRRHRSGTADPQRLEVCVSALGAKPHVAIDRLRGLAPEPAEPGTAILAEHNNHAVLEFEVLDLDADEIAGMHPGVSEQTDDCQVPAVSIELPLAGADDAAGSSSESTSGGITGTMGGRMRAIGERHSPPSATHQTKKGLRLRYRFEAVAGL